jgi:acyl dehydratase
VSEVEFPIGTYEDAVKMIGVQQEVRFGEAPVSWALIKAFAAMIEDPNVTYWDEERARQLWGSVVAPPGMLHAWVMPLLWRPEGKDERTALAARVPLPGTSLINVSTDVEYFRPVRVGETINVVETLVSVSEEKATRLGVGHFVTSVAVYRNGEGAKIADYYNTLYRFTPSGVDAG